MSGARSREQAPAEATAVAVATVTTQPVAGMVYLRRPCGRQPTDSITAPEVIDSSRGERPEKTLVGGPATEESRRAATREIGRLLSLWLEAYDGRRPVAVLRRGPYSPGALDELRSHIKATIEKRGQVPSRLMQVHLPPTHRRRLSFTASAAIDGRIRAMVGHLARYESRWRIESVTVLSLSTDGR